jgi:hypothetical protein
VWTAGSPEFDLDPDALQDAEAIGKQMTVTNHADCVIVGAGIAGLVAGRSLHTRGFEGGGSTTVPNSSPFAIPHFAPSSMSGWRQGS